MNTIKNTYDKLKRKIALINNNQGDVNNKNIELYENNFKEALENDLNTSNALTVLYDVIKDNTLTNNEKITLITKFDQVLSLDLLSSNTKEISEIDEKYINDMINKRNEAKKEKNYNLADQIRDELLQKGIILIDTREGTKFKVE